VGGKDVAFERLAAMMIPRRTRAADTGTGLTSAPSDQPAVAYQHWRKSCAQEARIASTMRPAGQQISWPVRTSVATVQIHRQVLDGWPMAASSCRKLVAANQA
jgi:hypothetical protein